jgi:hypothetical protein
LSRSTASLARGYGICVRRPKCGQNAVFAGYFRLDWPVHAPEGCPKKHAFVGRYGNLLLQSTVFLCHGVRYLKAALFGAVVVGGYGITPASSILENGGILEKGVSSEKPRFWSVADKGERLSDGTVSAAPEGALKVPVLSESTVSSGVAADGYRDYINCGRDVLAVV